MCFRRKQQTPREVVWIISFLGDVNERLLCLLSTLRSLWQTKTEFLRRKKKTKKQKIDELRSFEESKKLKESFFWGKGTWKIYNNETRGDGRKCKARTCLCGFCWRFFIWTQQSYLRISWEMQYFVDEWNEMAPLDVHFIQQFFGILYRAHFRLQLLSHNKGSITLLSLSLFCLLFSFSSRSQHLRFFHF